VKAAGGIRTIADVLAFLHASARRFGSTRTDQLVVAFKRLGESEQRAFDEFLEMRAQAVGRA
jgi:deoxyribose-phosphate aldolase